MSGAFSHMLGNFNAAASGSDVVIAVQEFDSRTTTGTLDVTTAALGGKTPKFVLVMGTGHRAANDPSDTATEHVSMGFATPTESAVVYSSSLEAYSITETNRGLDQTAQRVIRNEDALGTKILATISAWIADGITLNFTTVSANSFRGVVVFFAGNDFEADLRELNLGTGTSAISVSSLATTPELVMLLGISHSTQIATQQPSGLHFGAALPDGTQKSIWRTEASKQADGCPELYISSNRICVDKNGATVNYNLTIGNFGASSFDITPSASAGDDRVILAVLNLGGKAVSLSDFTTPTSTGSQTISASFTPQFALGVLTSLEARDTASTTSDLQGGFGFGVMGSNEQWAAAFRADSGAATPDTASNIKTGALRGASATSTAEVVASFTSFSGSGVNLNYSAVAANAKMGFMLAIEA